MPCEFVGPIHTGWKSSPPGAPLIAVKVCPPSFERYKFCDGTYTTSAFFGSTKISLIYQYPSIRLSSVAFPTSLPHRLTGTARLFCLSPPVGNRPAVHDCLVPPQR